MSLFFENILTSLRILFYPIHTLFYRRCNMVNDKDDRNDVQNVHSIQDDAMNRANQTLNKIKEEVKNLIDENQHANKLE
jgi:hypothetical protein